MGTGTLAFLPPWQVLVFALGAVSQLAAAVLSESVLPGLDFEPESGWALRSDFGLASPWVPVDSTWVEGALIAGTTRAELKLAELAELELAERESAIQAAREWE